MSNEDAQLQKAEESLPELIQLAAIGAPHRKEEAEAIARQELQFLHDHKVYDPKIFEGVAVESIPPLIKTAMRWGLSLDPNAGLVYLMRRGVKDASGNWQNVIEVRRSPDGEISYARQNGRILDHMPPETEEDDKGRVIKVSFSYLKPSYPEPRWETREFGTEDFKKWAKASHSQNARGKRKEGADETKLNRANPLYFSHNGWIDPEFAKAKAIKHSLKKLGTNPNERKQGTPVEFEDNSAPTVTQEAGKAAIVEEDAVVSDAETQKEDRSEKGDDGSVPDINEL